MTDRPCPLDGTALPPGAVICAGCTTRTRQYLREVPAVLDELDLALSRQTSMPPAGGTGGCPEGCGHGEDDPGCVAGVRLVLDVRASEAALALRLCLHGWARVWDEETHHDPSLWHLRAQAIATAQAQAQAATLALVADLARRAWAPDLAREIRAAVEEGWAAVDRPPESRVVGNCPVCGVALYAPEGAEMVRCRNCSTVSVRVEVREASLAESRKLVSAVQMASVLGLHPVTGPARVRQWKARGLIEVVRHDVDGRPLYRVADGQALLLRIGTEDEDTGRTA